MGRDLRPGKASLWLRIRLSSPHARLYRNKTLPDLSWPTAAGWHRRCRPTRAGTVPTECSFSRVSAFQSLDCFSPTTLPYIFRFSPNCHWYKVNALALLAYLGPPERVERDGGSDTSDSNGLLLPSTVLRGRAQDRWENKRRFLFAAPATVLPRPSVRRRFKLAAPYEAMNQQPL